MANEDRYIDGDDGKWNKKANRLKSYGDRDDNCSFDLPMIKTASAHLKIGDNDLHTSWLFVSLGLTVAPSHKE